MPPENQQPSGKNYAELFEDLPEDVKLALKVPYPGCCPRVPGKRIQLKHLFTDEHAIHLTPEQYKSLPVYVCPAMDEKGCSDNLRGKRRDAAHAHIKTCAAYRRLYSNVVTKPPPVVFKRGDLPKLREGRGRIKSPYKKPRNCKHELKREELLKPPAPTSGGAAIEYHWVHWEPPTEPKHPT
ncbi:hypothetical protein BC834DRAFT_969877 [Gloeopeniophorella convolvens]|nr:hypothetical protein BC834DRAFT_969877 [Gloeopeniophorella convolvens]